jgi:hypothetical protein
MRGSQKPLTAESAEEQQSAEKFTWLTDHNMGIDQAK